MREPYLELSGLSVGYGGRALIRGISLSVRRGEIVTLIGPNGAGKSTILKTISRQLPAVEGRILLGGRELTEYSRAELSRKLAVVLTGGLHPEYMTCHDVAALGRYPYTGRLGLLSRRDEEKVEAAMAAVHAEDLGERDFNAVSDGQKQRVLLARAICQEPEIILLDEPTSFLDIRHKLELLEILKRMANGQGITVLMSLHEIDLAMKVSDRIVFVKGDTIARVGPPEELFTEASVRDLYDLTAGSFDPLFGSAELPPVKGEPEVLVLSSGGSGIPVYRKLQREGRPFAAGILPENDLDCHLARILASEVITAPPFEPVPEAAFMRCRELIRSCREVICPGLAAGTEKEHMAELLREAEDSGKLHLPERDAGKWKEP